MTDSSYDERLLHTFVALADTLVADFDIVDLLQSLVDACGEHLQIAAAGILLSDGSGDLEVMASTSDASRLVELMQLSAESGPCIECFRTGESISVESIADAPEEWSAFRDSALEHGFAAVDAVPLRLRDTTIGALNLLRAEAGPARPFDLVVARAFADVATIGILHERSIRETDVLTQQLQLALSSRVLIEQAKGVVSYTNNVPIDEAFAIIRNYARAHRLPLSEVAGRLVSRDLQIANEGA